MKFRHLITLACALAALAAPAFSLEAEKKPGERRGRQGPGARIQTLKGKLNLTEEQEKKLEPILEKRREKLRELRNDTALSKQDRRAKLREIFRNSTEEILPILTPEQKATWKEEVGERPGKRAGAKKRLGKNK